ncbi:hypothetical protein [Arsukibacterium sp.]|uniref:hypothetical protein n=1 Tax=Arsukibacterium sp. TaxID=1977258 RepID=UPI003564197E
MKNMQAFSLSLEQRVLWVRATGIWNDRTANDYVEDFRELVRPLLAAPWAIVLDIRHWQLSPASVFSVLTDNTRWCFEHNLRYVVTIYADNALVMWQFVKATDTMKPRDLVSQVAEDEHAARKALQTAGYLAG